MKNPKSLLSLALACAALTLSLAVRAQAQTISYVADFDGFNGQLPLSPVIQATDGNFYGTTYGDYEDPVGNVFRVTPSGELSQIYKFCSQTMCIDGNYPTSLVLGVDGNLYGAAASGGAYGRGTIFKMSLGGEITTLYSFCAASSCDDGAFPTGVVLASDGNFYGTTSKGGTHGKGTLFRVSPSGEYNVVYSFCSRAECADGAYFYYPPIQGTDGNFYGTSLWGGALNGGVVYQVTPSGAEKILYSFCADANNPCAAGSYIPTVTQGADGNFYGTTEGGGSGMNPNGLAFKLTPNGEYTVLYTFPSSGVGGYPQSTLFPASDGNLYGTTGGGPPWSWNVLLPGEIFEITKEGAVNRLRAFQTVDHDGFDPLAPPFQATHGNFYGTTGLGGFSGRGTVFQFTNGLGPLVETVPTGGKVGQSVLILGNNLSGSTSVTFNGVAASFTVESDTYIKATVPKGATTGVVSVVTPSGTLNSNPQFVVTK